MQDCDPEIYTKSKNEPGAEPSPHRSVDSSWSLQGTKGTSPSRLASGKARSRSLNCVQISRPKSSLKETAAGVGNRKEKSYTSVSLLFLKMRKLRARKGKRLTEGHVQLVSGGVGPEEPRFLTSFQQSLRGMSPSHPKGRKESEERVCGAHRGIHWARASLEGSFQIPQIT